MHLKFLISLIFFCSLVAGCSSVPNEINRIERIMDVHPDSALCLLQQMKPESYKSSSDHALYNLLLFQALEKNDKILQPDSLINFSINYFQHQNNNPRLAACYFWKGHMCMHIQHYDKATELFLKALECLQVEKDYTLLGRIYSDMGDICIMQLEYKEAKKKYITSFECFNHTGNVLACRHIILSIGRVYSNNKNHRVAQRYYLKALFQMTDSMLCGIIYQEMGINYYQAKQFDSAQYYLRKSLLYPFKGSNYAIRCYHLADLLFDLEQYDSSFQYATLALNHRANFYTQRDCYRILVNIEYTRHNVKPMGIYMAHYQDCCDSIHKLELQTKSIVLEKIQNTTREANGTKKNMILVVSLLLIVLILSSFVVVYLYRRNRLKREQLNAFKNQLNSKQEFVSQGLIKKIEEAKALQADKRKNASAEEREKLDKELYNNVLHLNDWDGFNREMNHAFNNIIITIKSEYPIVNQKEITWCCLHLLDIPHADRMLLLESTSDSLYKLKQRLAQKLNLKTTKDLDLFLKGMTAIKN